MKHRLLSTIAMIQALSMVDNHSEYARDPVSIGPPPDLSPDDIEKMKLRIATERRQKRKRRGK